MHIKQIQTRFCPEGQDRNYDKTNCINSTNCIYNLLNPSLILRLWKGNSLHLMPGL